MSTAPEVISFCQKEIIESGLVLDEDLSLLYPIECKERKPFNYSIIQGFAMLGTGIGAALYAVKQGNAQRNVRIGILFSLPVASSILHSIYLARKAKSQKESIAQLLVEFRNLSRIHAEVNDFVKHFNYVIETSTDQLLNQSEGTIQDLSEHTCDVQSMITCEMRQVIIQMHVGLQDVSVDLSGFEQATAAIFNYDSLSDCLRNINFVEGQVVLLRSHLLTSMVILSSCKGNPGIFGKILDNHIPSLVFIIKEGIQSLKVKLDEVRFPAHPPTLMCLSKLETIVGNRKYISVPRMRKHVNKINDGICFTLAKLRTLLVTLENVESESQMILLQETVTNVTQELLKCCRSSADLEKLIQLVSSHQKHKELDLPSAISKIAEEDCATASTAELVAEKDELAADLDYQIFGNYMSESEDDSEMNAVRFYQKHINNTADWLAELKQSEEFQRRQNKFHTGKIVTSTPLDQLFPPTVEPVASVISLDSTTSSGDFVTLQIPPPPPMYNSVLSASELSEILQDSTSSAKEGPSGSSAVPPSPKTPVMEGTSSLLTSLKGIINKMGPREEEQFE